MNEDIKRDDTTTAPGTGPQSPPGFSGPQGWICPRCGAANAPFVSQCPCVQAVPSYPSHPGWPDPAYPVGPYYPPQWVPTHPWAVPVGYREWAPLPHSGKFMAYCKHCLKQVDMANWRKE